ncbi:hypothetical protein O181_038291 [Austropuccinia psidii MF-1]|uniref:Uncharacterized protein n=1 Tax=Austropuccinia psidii MF-1 TaxID=1389203 RepID=A0A9Q3DDQ0_9BASI|nr:hypothetical protein [Austropuccinia psidii MF-1]
MPSITYELASTLPDHNQNLPCLCLLKNWPLLPPYLRHKPSLHFHTPASFSPQLQIITLPHFPLIFQIQHPYAHAIIAFLMEGYYLPQLTILPLTQRFCFPNNTSAALKFTILTLLHPCLIISTKYHSYAPEFPCHVLNLPSLSSHNDWLLH